jgi:predicted O-methyltransferase YrrM
MTDVRLRLALALSKARHRMPARLAASHWWDRCEDRLVVGHHLSGARRSALAASWRECRTPAELHDFAVGVFPPHQIRAEILQFLDFARKERPRTVLEVGMGSGGTNFLLGAALPDVTLKIGIDLFVRRAPLLEMFCRQGCRQVFFSASSYSPETVARVRDVLAGRPLDLAFIDGDHSYAGVKADFEAYAPLVRSGGLVVFHDIVPDYRTRFGRNTGRWVGEVPRFWRETRDRFSETWEFIETPGQDGLGIGAGRVA